MLFCVVRLEFSLGVKDGFGWWMFDWSCVCQGTWRCVASLTLVFCFLDARFKCGRKCVVRVILFIVFRGCLCVLIGMILEREKAAGGRVLPFMEKYIEREYKQAI